LLNDQTSFVLQLKDGAVVVCSSFPIGGVGSTMRAVVVVVSELINGRRSQRKTKVMGTMIMQKHHALDLTLVGTATIWKSPTPLPTNLYVVSAM
jgi:hypothetical protein